MREEKISSEEGTRMEADRLKGQSALSLVEQKVGELAPCSQ